MSGAPADHYLALTCGAMARSVYAAAAESASIVTVELFEQGLHETPGRLRAQLQERIDEVPAGAFDAILLAYGLCGGATAGLTARHLPLVMVRAHDCITLYLGDRRRYQREFEQTPGTYWMSRDYLERNRDGEAVSLGATPNVYAQYIDRYGQENAEYLLEVMGSWTQHYDRIGYIETGPPGDETFRVQAQEKARAWRLRFAALKGDRRLVTALIEGSWDDEEFIVVHPGQRIVSTPSNGIVTTEEGSAL